MLHLTLFYARKGRGLYLYGFSSVVHFDSDTDDNLNSWIFDDFLFAWSAVFLCTVERKCLALKMENWLSHNFLFSVCVTLSC